MEDFTARGTARGEKMIGNDEKILKLRASIEDKKKA